MSLPKETPTAKPQKKKRTGLFLKFSSHNDKALDGTKKILTSHKGSLPLYFYFEDTKKYELAPKDNFVAQSETLIFELRALLGDGNVALII